MLDVREEELLKIEDGLYQICINLEHRAWECPFCGSSEEYYLINGIVVLGTGGDSTFANGKKSNSCSKCWEKADEWHKST